MSDIAIKVENLSKLYRIGTAKSGSLRDSLADRWGRMTGSKQGGTAEDFWALNDVSFDIRQGEAVGIIGKNGAGKSTLLKILSRITEPTKGRIEINGRVASLLEVGTGFHAELSGRENIYLNGTILGMTRREIKRKFDEIVDFSGVEKFIDTPVKFYSSGMYVRLAFAVAAHLEPEILIIDEVLAVGDAEFQKKCLGKMGEVAGQGRTVIFVSHQMAAVQSLCRQIIWMKKGRLEAKTTEVNKAISLYLAGGETQQGHQLAWQAGSQPLHNEVHTLHAFSLKDTSGEVLTTPIVNTEPVSVEIEGRLLKEESLLNIGFALYDAENRMLCWSWCKDFRSESHLLRTPGHFRIQVVIPARFLNEGRYRIEIISGLHYAKWFLEPGLGPSLSFEILGGFANVVFTPEWQWEESLVPA